MKFIPLPSFLLLRYLNHTYSYNISSGNKQKQMEGELFYFKIFKTPHKSQSSTPIYDPLNYKRVMWRIKKIWEEGSVKFVHHANEQMKKRGLDVSDVENISRYGRIVEHSQPAELWRYKIEGLSLDHGKAACIVELNKRLIIITVISIKR